MSRLAGRVTFHNNSDDDRQESSSTWKNDSRSGKGRNEAHFRQPQKPRSEDCDFDQPRTAYGGGKPRGRGPNYGKTEKAVYQPPRRYENNDRFERSDRQERFKRQEKPDQSERFEEQRKPTAKVEDVVPSEELLDFEDIITQISDLSVRSDRSALQIKRNIIGSQDLLDTMEEDEWQRVCESMMTTALDGGEPEFIADLLVALFQNNMFSAVISDVLMTASSQLVIDGAEKPIPALFAAILCAHWPRQYAKAFDNVNPILYNIVCVIKGWILVVTEDTERYHKVEKKPVAPDPELQNQEEEEKAEEVEEERIIEEPEVVNRCALALSDLCDVAQKQLWFNWMSLTDEIYQCVKPAITHNPNVTGDVKERLLNTLMAMNQWTKSRKVTVKQVMTQTATE